MWFCVNWKESFIVVDDVLFLEELKPSTTIICIKFRDEWRRRVSHLMSRNASSKGKASKSSDRSGCDGSLSWQQQNFFNQTNKSANNCNTSTPISWNGQANERILSALDRKKKSTLQPFECKLNCWLCEDINKDKHSKTWKRVSALTRSLPSIIRHVKQSFQPEYHHTGWEQSWARRNQMEFADLLLCKSLPKVVLMCFQKACAWCTTFRMELWMLWVTTVWSQVYLSKSRVSIILWEHRCCSDMC